MPTLNFDFYPFGTNERGFINAIKHYSDIKGGYDGTISSYGAAYTVRPLAVVDDKGKAVSIGTVPIRNDVSFNKILSKIPEQVEDQAGIVFKFFIPLKKGFQVSAIAELTSWNGIEVLAKNSSRSGKYVALGDPENSGNLVIKANEEEYAYVPIILDGNSGTNPDEPLQSKIAKWRNKNSNISKQVFILRVWQMVWPAKMKKSDVESKDFEVRDDSIILEIKD